MGSGVKSKMKGTECDGIDSGRREKLMMPQKEENC